MTKDRSNLTRNDSSRSKRRASNLFEILSIADADFATKAEKVPEDNEFTDALFESTFYAKGFDEFVLDE